MVGESSTLSPCSLWFKPVVCAQSWWRRSGECSFRRVLSFFFPFPSPCFHLLFPLFFCSPFFFPFFSLFFFSFFSVFLLFLFFPFFSFSSLFSPVSLFHFSIFSLFLFVFLCVCLFACLLYLAQEVGDNLWLFGGRSGVWQRGSKQSSTNRPHGAAAPEPPKQRTSARCRFVGVSQQNFCKLTSPRVARPGHTRRGHVASLSWVTGVSQRHVPACCASWAECMPMIRERHPQVAQLLAASLEDHPDTQKLSDAAAAARSLRGVMGL